VGLRSPFYLKLYSYFFLSLYLTTRVYVVAVVSYFLLRPLVDGMDDSTRHEAGIDPPSSHPPWKATGERSIRARNVSKRHLKLLDDLQVELGDVGRREAIAALCEYYYENPKKVVSAVKETDFR